MDTIIYLYHSRDMVGFVTEKWQESDYCLIRFGIPSFLWQNLQRFEEYQQQEWEFKQNSVARRRGCFFFGNHRKRKHKDEYKYAEVDKGRSKGEKRAKLDGNPDKRLDKKSDTKPNWDVNATKQMIQLLDEVKELQIALGLLGNNPHWTYCAYEGFLREKIDTRIWYQYWNIPEFEDYNQLLWVEKLMKYTVHDRYIILGYASCIPKILCECARQMRGIKWFLKLEQYTQEVQEFIEAFYEEYGLLIELHLLDVDEEWVRVHPSSEVPVNVLDFSKEEKLSTCDVAKGSVWLDMDSMEGKCMRIETRSPGMNYFSLKKEWKQWQSTNVRRQEVHIYR